MALGETFSIALAVTNTGAEGTPFGTGWHPFFTRPPGTRLAVGTPRTVRALVKFDL